MNKNEDKLASFVAYCQEHPDERFWQALRNWSPYMFIYGSDMNYVQIEGKVEQNPSEEKAKAMFWLLADSLHDTFYHE